MTTPYRGGYFAPIALAIVIWVLVAYLSGSIIVGFIAYAVTIILIAVMSDTQGGRPCV